MASPPLLVSDGTPSLARREGHVGQDGRVPISLPASLTTLTARVPLPDELAIAAADLRQSQMTKPAGSMGRLEILGSRLAGMYAVCPPPIPEPAVVVVFAGDHGVHAQGVSPWPQEVTVQMVANVASGGAVVNALARQVGAQVRVVDVGVAGTLPDPVVLGPGVEFRSERVCPGTGDFTTGPALTREQAEAAVLVGAETADRLIDGGARLLVTGDLGIGNTTASAALIAVFTGADPGAVTGPGAGSDARMLAHKISVIRAGLELHRPDPTDPVGVLAAFGGAEHAALAGFIVAAAARRVPVVLDGVIAGAAALSAAALCPGATAYLIAGHRSTEPGATAALAHLGLEPLLDLGLRLGEGSGGVLAVPVVQAAARLLGEVATFESAGVAGREG